jgi:hypothetical protein
VKLEILKLPARATFCQKDGLLTEQASRWLYAISNVFSLPRKNVSKFTLDMDGLGQVKWNATEYGTFVLMDTQALTIAFERNKFTGYGGPKDYLPDSTRMLHVSPNDKITMTFPRPYYPLNFLFIPL